MSKPWIGLCHRCEHRARFYECGRGPRCECGDTGEAKYACYMYTPVSPVVLAPIEGETRSLALGWGLAGRGRGVRVFRGPVVAKDVDGGLLKFISTDLGEDDGEAEDSEA